MKVLFIGCGDIAQRTAKLLSKKYDCFGLRRNPAGLPSEITPIVADASDPQQLLSVASNKFEIWIATITPAEFTRQAYQQSYLAVAQAMAQTVNALQQAPKLIIWVSSTSVYGDNNGDWVDETTKPNPVTFSGKILLQAEQIIQN